MKFTHWIILSLTILVGIYLINSQKKNDLVMIVLAPETEDATRALDDHMKRFAGQVAVKNFTVSEIEDEEMRDAQRVDIAKDIQTVISAQAGKKISVYGPALNSTIRDAYTDVIGNFPDATTEFYFYEDQPATEEFKKTATVSLQKFLEDTTGLLLERKQDEGSGEVIYKILRF